jgi:hypothetical protein
MVKGECFPYPPIVKTALHFASPKMEGWIFSILGVQFESHVVTAMLPILKHNRHAFLLLNLLLVLFGDSFFPCKKISKR